MDVGNLIFPNLNETMFNVMKLLCREMRIMGKTYMDVIFQKPNWQLRFHVKKNNNNKIVIPYRSIFLFIYFMV